MKPGLAAVCAIAVCLAWAPRARAELPAGSYTIEVNGDSGLIVPTGAGEVCQDGVCVSTDVSTNANGVVSGSGNVAIDTDITADVDLAFTGRVSGTTAKPKVVLAFTAAGTADGLDVAGKGKLKCAVGSTPGELDCGGKLKLCAFQAGKKLGCQKLPFATQVGFARQAFSLELDLETILGATVIGDASARIGVVSIASYTVKGKYKSSADASNLALKSADRALKTKVALKKVVLEGGAPTAGKAVFKLMGQKGVVELPSIAPTSAHPQCPIAGQFCDVNQDTAALFGAPPNAPVVDGTIVFGILEAPTRSR